MVNIMTTDDKLNAVSEIVTPLYESGETNHDLLCGSVFNDLPDGIGFGEISALVKQCGIDGGFIVPIAQRRELALTDMETDTTKDGLPDTFPAYEKYIAGISDEFNVPATWVKNKLNAMYKSEDYDIPEKSTVTDWQRCMVETVQNDPYVSKTQMKSRLIAMGKTETGTPLAMLGMIKLALGQNV